MSQVLDAIATHAASRPGDLALTGRDIRLTWAQLPDAVDELKASLSACLDGLPTAAPVAVALDNGPAWVVVDLALIALGRPSLPLPPFFSPEQRRHALTDAGACLLVSAPTTTDAPTTVVAGAGIAAERLNLPPVELHPGTAKITYTSGSTGAPKGVCLSQAQMEAVAGSLIEVIGVEFAGLHLGVLPLGVLLENVAGLYTTLMAGGCYHTRGLVDLGFSEGMRPDLRRLVDVIEAEGATSLILVPELLRALTLALALGGRKLPALRLVAVGGAKVSPDLIAMARAAGLPAYEGYGLSECASVVALNTPSADRTGTVGRVLPHLKLALGKDGEVVVGPQPFLGYVGGQPQSGAVWTGDLGQLDAEGWLKIDGRKSNVLITAYGRNIAPEWVESELLAQPEIAQAAVFGEGAPELCAVLVPIRNDLPDEMLEAAVARANARLPTYARVARWTRRTPFDASRGELTGNGRPRRGVLRETHQAFIELQT